MDNDRIVAGTVVGDEEGPPPAVTLVLVTAMEDVAVEEKSISRLHLHFYQRKHLRNTRVISHNTIQYNTSLLFLDQHYYCLIR